MFENGGWVKLRKEKENDAGRMRVKKISKMGWQSVLETRSWVAILDTCGQLILGGSIASRYCTPSNKRPPSICMRIPTPG